MGGEGFGKVGGVEVVVTDALPPSGKGLGDRVVG